MSLAELKKEPIKGSVMGIDCSTRSFAWAIFDADKNPVRCGEIFFVGKDIYERLLDANRKITSLVNLLSFDVDFIFFEGAILVGNNSRTGIMLAYVYGAVMSILMDYGIKVVNVTPLSWQAYIGNPNLKAAEKNNIRKDFPGKSDSWYKEKGREFRKQRTLKFSRQFFNVDGSQFYEGGSDNTGDAIGIAWYGANHLEQFR